MSTSTATVPCSAVRETPRVVHAATDCEDCVGPHSVALCGALPKGEGEPLLGRPEVECVVCEDLFVPGMACASCGEPMWS